MKKDNISFVKNESIEVWETSMQPHRLVKPETAYNVWRGDLMTHVVIHKRTSSIWSQPSGWQASDPSGNSLMDKLPKEMWRKKFKTRKELFEAIEAGSFV